MSLKTFLAVGHSLSGPDKKSPFEMRKENLLPRFGSGPRFSATGNEEGVLEQTDWFQAPQPQETSTGNTVEAEKPAAFQPVQSLTKTPVSVASTTARRGLLWYLGLGFLRREKQSEIDLVQSELALEKIRVMRNDLSDSDLEVVVKKKKTAERPLSKEGQRSQPASNWSTLAAKLFELGQNQR